MTRKRKRRRTHEEIRVRLYYGEDDQLLEWLRQFDDAPLGERSRAVKEALLQGIQEQATARDGPLLTDEDLESIRRVVEVGVSSAMRRFGGVAVTSLQADGEDEETASMLDGLGESLIVEE
jgi:hypothetical protein